MSSAYEQNALSSDKQSSHRREASFSYRLPTPPRIIIPPPIMSTDTAKVFVGRIIHPQDPNLDVEFLNHVDYSNMFPATQEWVYEHRRHIQSILPFLYLGPMVEAKKIDVLQKEDITMMLAVRPRQSGDTNAAKRAARELGIEFQMIEAPHGQALIRTFGSATKLINEHLERVYKQSRASGNPKLGKVFVFCESGNDKSAAIVAAYIAEMYEGIDHIKAMQTCQDHRFCVNFDDTLKQLLQSYNDILTARRTVAQNGQIQPMAHVRPSQQCFTQTPIADDLRRQKRYIEDTYEDDEMEEIQNMHELERTNGRTLFSPYTDTTPNPT